MYASVHAHTRFCITVCIRRHVQVNKHITVSATKGFPHRSNKKKSHQRNILFSASPLINSATNIALKMYYDKVK